MTHEPDSQDRDDGDAEDRDSEDPATEDRADDLDDVHLGEVPEGLGSDLYPKHLESLSRDPAFSDGVLSFSDADGTEREIALDDVDSAMEDGPGSSRTKIVLRNGAIVIATGAVVAGAIAAVRYRRRHK